MSVVLRASNTDLLVRGKVKTYLSSAVAAGESALTVESYAGFTDNAFLIVGLVGEERTEIVQINDAAINSTITLQSALVFAHPKGTPVTVVRYNQIEFYHSTTTSTSDIDLTVTATAISVDDMESIYEAPVATTTGYGFYRWKETEGNTFSEYSDPIPYAGYDLDIAQTIFDRALSVTSTSLSPRLKKENLIDFLNDWVAYVNSRNHMWSEAKVLDAELKTLATGDFEIDLPTNPAIARTNDPSAIISLRINEYLPLTYTPQREWQRAILNLRFTTLATAAVTADTTLVLTNSSSFADTGSVLINGDTIAYTGNTRSTNTLTGVTGIQAAGHAVGAYVLQQYQQDVPTIYTVTSKGKIRVWPIAGSIVNNKILFIDYYQRIPTVNTVGDSILLKNIQSAIDYVGYRIKKHVAGGTLAVSDEEYMQFSKSLDTLIENDNPGEPGRIILR